ncbi:MAG: sensor histidine kinase [Balneolaceae bacterium]
MLVIVLLFVLGVKLIGVMHVGSKVQNGLRGFIYAEGQWSKAQKAATIDLSSYIHLGDPVFLDRFRGSISIIENTRRGREELASEHPNYDEVTRTLLLVNDLPGDVADMIWAVERLGNFALIQRALKAWEESDKYIALKHQIAERAVQNTSNGDVSEENKRALIRELYGVDSTLTDLETEFSTALREAAVRANRIVFWTIVVFTTLFGLVAAIVTVAFFNYFKNANQEIRASEERFKSVLDHSRDVIYQYEKGAPEYDYMSRSVEAVLGYPLEYVKKGGPSFILEKMHPDDLARMEQELDNIQHLPGKEELLSDTEFRVLHADGQYVWVNNKRTALKNEDGEVQFIVGNVRDISNRKKYVDHISRSLDQKQTLLSEIHHRVKNNLAIVSSLIELQKNELKNPELEEGYRVIQLRIRSIALIHEKLYNTETLSDVELDQYLKDLTEMIVNGYSFAQKTIDIQLDTTPITVKVEQAVPVGLICNELINNCFKHGFKGRKEGILRVTLKQKGHEVELGITDNGGALPDDFDLDAQQSLGSTLLKTLSRQLDGRIEYTAGEETTFRVLFPLAEPEPST